MRLPRSFSALLVATVFLLTACNNNNQDTNSGTDTTKTAPPASSPANTPMTTTVTTPQNMMVIVHKVADYAKWKAAYEAHDSARVAAGIHSYVIGRGVMDANTLLVALKVDDTAKAMAFGKDPSLKAAMQKGGVIGAPKTALVTTLFQDTGTIASQLRSSVMFTVKDWDTWFKNFQEGAQERTDNGVAVRAYGHDAADNRKVRVVTALIDSAKAMAYFKSDQLKKRMEASGVVGQPDRFIYRVVQRY